MIEKRMNIFCPLIRWYRLLFRAPRGQRNEGTLAGMRLCRPHFGIQRTERHHPSRRSVMEAAAFDAAHVDVAFVHERLDEERERLAAGPEGWVGADMRPERFHQLEAATNVGDDLRKYGRATTREHA